jgi:hypothetical protein
MNGPGAAEFTPSDILPKDISPENTLLTGTDARDGGVNKALNLVRFKLPLRSLV